MFAILKAAQSLVDRINTLREFSHAGPLHYGPELAAQGHNVKGPVNGGDASTFVGCTVYRAAGEVGPAHTAQSLHRYV